MTSFHLISFISDDIVTNAVYTLTNENKDNTLYIVIPNSNIAHYTEI